MKALGSGRFAAMLLCLALALGTPAPGHGHQDHDPRFEGLVMMYFDLHFEVVLGEEGAVRVYYSDVARAELPAAVVSDLRVDILREGAAPETVVMGVSAAGDYWEGQGAVVQNRSTVVRLGFVFQGEPLVFEFPAWLFPAFQEHAPDDKPQQHSA